MNDHRPTARPGLLPRPQDDHYLRLPEARAVATDAARRVAMQLEKVIAARAMMGIHGDVGLGKTFAVHATLRELAPDTTIRLQVHLGMKNGDIHTALAQALELPPEVPYERLVHTLADTPNVLLCDEAQHLSATAFEYLRTLWDRTQRPLVFVGADSTHKKLRDRRALASRIHDWEQFRPLTPADVLTHIPAFHPLWEQADNDLIMYTDDYVCHGNFRSWANVTYHARDEMARNAGIALDKKLIRWIMSRLDSTMRDF
ncbi:AAA domain-containing protein [Streptomyces sp. TLI_053]|uniref:ATP-binding protein n=1 Tax=Streptomyces sp. TLI_053 TaxID=1855352 RepID=UPI000879B6B8|nr:ATP-binding protein [Streptomyces sp. TLI_053]SDS49622.1 AAA domain-containing protein [Streptomyces sp. TLI_053]